MENYEWIIDHLEVSKGRIAKSIVVLIWGFKSQKRVVIRERYIVNYESCYLWMSVLKGVYATLQKHLNYVFALQLSTSYNSSFPFVWFYCLLEPSVLAYSHSFSSISNIIFLSLIPFFFPTLFPPSSTFFPLFLLCCCFFFFCLLVENAMC